MRRLILIIAFSTVASACAGDASQLTTTSTTTTSSSTTTPTTTTSSTTTTSTTTSLPEATTTTADPLPVEPQYVLLLDGFGEFGVLGDDAVAVYDAFAAAFGDATADSDWLSATGHGCSFDGSMRTVTWIEPGVRLTFVDGESDHGDGPHLAHYSTVLPVDPPWELVGGIRRGMTFEDVDDAYPDAEVVMGGVLDVIRLIPEVDSFVSVDVAGEIREFFAGTDYCTPQR